MTSETHGSQTDDHLIEKSSAFFSRLAKVVNRSDGGMFEESRIWEMFRVESFLVTQHEDIVLVGDDLVGIGFDGRSGRYLRDDRGF